MSPDPVGVCAAGDAAGGGENPDSFWGRDGSADQNDGHGAHRFWPLVGGLANVRDEIRARLVGDQQLTDAVLLDLAIRNQGRLATFDRRILALLPVDSILRDAVAVIPA